jgi:ubiquinone/menaquinone biosynthesis C-methylase UbiE
MNASTGATAIARRLFQERLFTWMMGGLFPEQMTLDGLHHILEIGCGPGSWCVDVAHAYPKCAVMGIDCNSAMIDYARSLRDLHGLQNVHFEVMNPCEILPIETSCFDLITFHFGVCSLPLACWPQLLRECVRITRPGGTIRVIEEDYRSQTNSNAQMEFSRLCIQLFQQNEANASPHEGRDGGKPMVEALLRDAGYQMLHQQTYTVDVSFGTERHESYIQHLHLLLVELLPKLHPFATQEELDHLCWHMPDELQRETFQGSSSVHIIWGKASEKRI